MKNLLRSKSHFIFAAVCVMSLMALSFQLLSFYHLYSNRQRLAQITDQGLTQYRTSTNFEKLALILKNGESGEAHERLQDLIQLTGQMEELWNMKMNQELDQDIRKFKKLIELNSNQSNDQEAMRVLTSKLTQLHELALKNNYPVIKSFAQNTSLQIVSTSKKNLAIKMANLKKELISLKKRVMGSILQANEKDQLISRLSGLENEVIMLLEIANYQRDLKKYTDQAQQGLASWIKQIETEQNHLGERLQNKIIFSIISLVLLIMSLVLFALAGFKKWKIWKFESTEIEEKKWLNIIDQGIIHHQNYIFHQVSPSTSRKLEEKAAEIKIGLEMGQWLKQAFPFPTCLIDHQSNIQWANKDFCEQLFLDSDEIESKKFTWINLKEYLHMRGDDPVQKAFQEDVAGVYPVRVFREENHLNMPFELYVTPLRGINPSYVLITLYPLCNLQDALKDQNKLIHHQFSAWLTQNDQQAKQELVSAGFVESIQEIELNIQKAVMDQALAIQERDEVTTALNNLSVDYEKLNKEHLQLQEQHQNAKENLVGLENIFIRYLGTVEQTEDFIPVIIRQMEEMAYFHKTQIKNIDEFRLQKNAWTKALDYLEKSSQELKATRWQMQENQVKLNKVKFLLPAGTSDKWNEVWNQFMADFKKLEVEIQQLELSLSKWKQQFQVSEQTQLMIPDFSSPVVMGHRWDELRSQMRTTERSVIEGMKKLDNLYKAHTGAGEHSLNH